MQAGADVEVKTRGWSLLHLMASLGKSAPVKFLLDSGAQLTGALTIAPLLTAVAIPISSLQNKQPRSRKDQQRATERGAAAALQIPGTRRA